MKDKDPIQQIKEGQKAALETLHELLQGKPILFAIGAISAMKGQAEPPRQTYPRLILGQLRSRDDDCRYDLPQKRSHRDRLRQG